MRKPLNTSGYVCAACRLPLQRNGKTGWRHAVNKLTKGQTCGLKPVPARPKDMPLDPGAKVTLWRPAGTVTIGHVPYRQRFHPGAYAYLIGTVTGLRQHGETVAFAVIESVDVARDGSGLTLHMEVIDAPEEVAA